MYRPSLRFTPSSPFFYRSNQSLPHEERQNSGKSLRLLLLLDSRMLARKTVLVAAQSVKIHAGAITTLQ